MAPVNIRCMSDSEIVMVVSGLPCGGFPGPQSPLPVTIVTMDNINVRMDNINETHSEQIFINR